MNEGKACKTCEEVWDAAVYNRPSENPGKLQDFQEVSAEGAMLLRGQGELEPENYRDAFQGGLELRRGQL